MHDAHRHTSDLPPTLKRATHGYTYRFSVCKYDAGQGEVQRNGSRVGAAVFERSVSVVNREGEIEGRVEILAGALHAAFKFQHKNM